MTSGSFHFAAYRNDCTLLGAPPFIGVEIRLAGPPSCRPSAPQGVRLCPGIRGGRKELHKGGLQGRLTRGPNQLVDLEAGIGGVGGMDLGAHTFSVPRKRAWGPSPRPQFWKPGIAKCRKPGVAKSPTCIEAVSPTQRRQIQLRDGGAKRSVPRRTAGAHLVRRHEPLRGRYSCISDARVPIAMG